MKMYSEIAERPQKARRMVWKFGAGGREEGRKASAVGTLIHADPQSRLGRQAGRQL